MAWKSRNPMFRPRMPSTRRGAISRFQIGTINRVTDNWSALTTATQLGLLAYSADEFQGSASVKMPGLAKVDCTVIQSPTTTATAYTDYFVIRIPAAVSTPTLTGALNWADLLKGIQVLGFKRLATGPTTIPRIVKIPTRSFPALSVSEEIRIFRVTRAVGGVATTGVNEVIMVPKFKVV